jgi:hypothetical protein
MTALGQTVLEQNDTLRDLITNCQPLLGDESSLMALVEHNVASRLAPWTALPDEGWTQGRVFGAQGELRWRAYGRLLRVVLITDEVELPNPDGEAGDTAPPVPVETRLRELGFANVADLNTLTVEDGAIFLWRGEPYVEAQVRRYLDNNGISSFVRYCGITS